MPIRRNSRSLSLEKRPSDSSRNLLVERLQELRWRLLKSIGAILMSAVIAFFFRTRIVTFLSIPFPEQASTFAQVGKPLVITGLAEGFIVMLNLSLAVGFLLALPLHYSFHAIGLLDEVE